MQSGKLRHKIALQKNVTPTAQKRSGEPSPTWQTWAYAFASIEPQSGNEQETASQITATVTHKIRLRYIEGVKPDQQILFGSRVFSIVSVLNKEERNIELELLVTEGV